MKIIVVGSGLAGVGVSEELRKLDPNCDITLITSESDGYYSRPLLSHGFSRPDSGTRVVLRSFDTIRTGGIQVIEGAKVTGILPASRRIEYALENELGKSPSSPITLSYESLVLALGSEAYVPPAWDLDRDHFGVLNGLSDLKLLLNQRNRLLAKGLRPKWAIVGGGLIGCELASDLAKAGDQVVLIHALNQLMERQLTPERSDALRLHLLTQDIDVKLSQSVTRFSRNAGKVVIDFENSESLDSDLALVATGFRPRIRLAQSAGLKTAAGIVTDGFLRTSDPHIYAVGDVAQIEENKPFAYVSPVRSQALWLASYLTGGTQTPWIAPTYKPMAKIHGFK